MNSDPNQIPPDEQLSDQQQSVRDVQIQGHNNTFNMLQAARDIILTQTQIIQISVEEVKTRSLMGTSIN
ncbi:MAG: hypothetical protein ACTS2F_31105 [Thainema sp.]